MGHETCHPGRRWPSPFEEGGRSAAARAGSSCQGAEARTGQTGARPRQPAGSRRPASRQRFKPGKEHLVQVGGAAQIPLETTTPEPEVSVVLTPLTRLPVEVTVSWLPPRWYDRPVPVPPPRITLPVTATRPVP